MDLHEIVIEGTLRPDGSLELDQKPSMAPGRVTVVLRPAADPPETRAGWWPYLQQVRANREAAAYPFMNEAEMEAHVHWLRNDEDRIDRIYQEMEQARREQS